MSTNYEEYYRQYPHGLGEPFKEFVEFFQDYPKKEASVLDLGAGQGRDSIFIAKMGHKVTVVDISPTGINQLITDAQKENLQIEGVIEDIITYKPSKYFDIIIIDRTLHMLNEEETRINVIKNAVKNLKNHGYILIADEKSNIDTIQNFFQNIQWKITYNQRGFIFVQRPN